MIKQINSSQYKSPRSMDQSRVWSPDGKSNEPQRHWSYKKHKPNKVLAVYKEVVQPDGTVKRINLPTSKRRSSI